MRLAEGGLDELAARIDRPGYRRGDVRRGVVHLGIGAFHRAHQAPVFETALDLTNPHEVADLASLSALRTAVGFLVAGLAKRRSVGLARRLAGRSNAAGRVEALLAFSPIFPGDAARDEVLRGELVASLSALERDGAWWTMVELLNREGWLA